jgi:hypothetical protein
MNKTKSKLFCRTATLKDLRLFYEGANDSEVRKNNLNRKRFITWDSHKIWFKKKIKDKKVKLYVFNTVDASVGQVRFEKKIKLLL